MPCASKYLTLLSAGLKFSCHIGITTDVAPRTFVLSICLLLLVENYEMYKKGKVVYVLK
jgi:hypothetical protein